MSSRTRLRWNAISAVVVLELIGAATSGSLDPRVYFSRASTLVLVLLIFFSCALLFALLGLLTLAVMRRGGMTDDTRCGYVHCPHPSVPLESTLTLGRRYTPVRCVGLPGRPHVSGSEWFHALCWQEMNGGKASSNIGANVCAQCRGGAATPNFDEWGL